MDFSACQELELERELVEAVEALHQMVERESERDDDDGADDVEGVMPHLPFVVSLKPYLQMGCYLLHQHHQQGHDAEMTQTMHSIVVQSSMLSLQSFPYWVLVRWSVAVQSERRMEP